MYQKILLGHSSKDSPYGDAVVSLLLKTGLSTNQILYSSDNTCGIPIGKNIYDYLRETIHDGAYVLYLLSDNYYDSIACMNEMGAAWMWQNDYLLLATPGFDYKNDKFQGGIVNPKDLAVPMDNMVRMRKFVYRIKELFGTNAGKILIEDALEEYFKELDEIECQKKPRRKWKKKQNRRLVALKTS